MSDLRVLKDAIYPNQNGQGLALLKPIERLPWAADDTHDLVSFRNTEYDSFTTFIVEKLVPWFFAKTYQRLKVIINQEYAAIC
jgi:hypothetical protein